MVCATQEHLDLLENLLRCKTRIGSMCSEGRPPKMRIPVTADDDDVFINNTIQTAMNRLNALRSELASAQEKIAEVEGERDIAETKLIAAQVRTDERIDEFRTLDEKLEKTEVALALRLRKEKDTATRIRTLETENADLLRQLNAAREEHIERVRGLEVGGKKDTERLDAVDAERLVIGQMYDKTGAYELTNAHTKGFKLPGYGNSIRNAIDAVMAKVNNTGNRPPDLPIGGALKAMKDRA